MVKSEREKGEKAKRSAIRLCALYSQQWEIEETLRNEKKIGALNSAIGASPFGSVWSGLSRKLKVPCSCNCYAQALPL